MNKIAAYEIALEQIELEKRASYLAEAYGAHDGHLPPGYLEAFDALEKEAGIGQAIQGIGKAITGGVYRAGKALGGTGASGSRTGIGGKMMDWASGVGGKATGGAAVARKQMVSKGMQDAGYKAPNAAQLAQARKRSQQIIGGVGVGGAALGTAGLGYSMGGG
jgi:hypothetical protein